MPIYNTTKPLIPAKALKRHRTFVMVMSGMLTLTQAAQELNLSLRQTQRLWHIFQVKQDDPWALIPKPRKRTKTVLTQQVKTKIKQLYEQQPGINVFHLTDQLNQSGITISRESVRQEVKNLKTNSRVKHGKTKPATRFEAKTFGQIVQMDTCVGAWLKGSGYQYLIACLDDCARFIVSASIFKTDSTWTNMCVIRDMIEKWGLPEVLYTDNASHFKTIRHEKLPGWLSEKEYPKTKIQEVLLQLGIKHVTHHPFNPRGKGKIERFFRFIQDRCLRHNPARNLVELNYQLHKWIQWYNYEHVNWTTKQKPCDRLSPSSFRPVPPETDLDKLFVVSETRKVKKDNSISFRGKTYLIPEKHHVAGLTVELLIAGSRITVCYQGRELINLDINS